MHRPSTRARRLLLIAAALLVAGALVAPVVLTNGPGGRAARCEPSLVFHHVVYRRRSTGATTQGTATGVGVLRGCGQTPSNMNVRSLLGIDPVRAVAIEGDPNLYVRTELCVGASGAALARCLRR